MKPIPPDHVREFTQIRPKTKVPAPLGGVMLTEQDLLALMHLVPDERLQREMMHYVERCEPPGELLRAVLENDLSEAVLACPDVGREAQLGALVRWCIGHAPHSCWGSAAKVRKWIGRRS